MQSQDSLTISLAKTKCHGEKTRVLDLSVDLKLHAGLFLLGLKVCHATSRASEYLTIQFQLLFKEEE